MSFFNQCVRCLSLSADWDEKLHQYVCKECFPHLYKLYTENKLVDVIKITKDDKKLYNDMLKWCKSKKSISKVALECINKVLDFKLK